MEITNRAVKGNEASKEKRIIPIALRMVIVQVTAVVRAMATMLVRTNQREAVTEIRVDNVNSH
jgi:flagellar basal body-associated protein FliL